ncbi:MAG: hypothetical protein R2882_08735 [Gemmatimonadales bacterium]
MSFFRRHFGLDAIDLIVHAVVTGLIMGFVGTNSHWRWRVAVPDRGQLGRFFAARFMGSPLRKGPPTCRA